MLPVTPVPENVPPEGKPPVREIAAEYTHKVSAGNERVTEGAVFTSMVCEADEVQLKLSAYVYVMVLPFGAFAGEKSPAFTPVPEYVPPAGNPPLRAKDDALLQTAAKELNDTDGMGFTVIVAVPEPVFKHKISETVLTE